MGSRRSRLHRPFDEPVARGRLHSAAVHGRPRRDACSANSRSRCRRRGVSLVISLTTTPMLCARFLRPAGGQRTGARRARIERLDASVGRVAAGMTGRWGGRSRTRGHACAARLVVIVLNGYLLVMVPKGFFPQQDNGLMMGTVQAVAGHVVSGDATDSSTDDVAPASRIPPLTPSSRWLGGKTTSNQARLFISLKPRPSREASADQVIARMRPVFAHDPRASVYLQASQDIRVGRASADAQYQVHAARRRSRVVEDVGPAPDRAAAQGAGHCRRQLGSAEQRARRAGRDRPRHRRAARRERQRDRSGAVRRVWAT